MSGLDADSIGCAESSELISTPARRSLAKAEANGEAAIALPSDRYLTGKIRLPVSFRVPSHLTGVHTVWND